MATSAEKRAWLAANGHPELAEGKGRLPAPLLAEFDAAHTPTDDYAPGTEPGDFEGDLPYVGADDPPPPPGDGEAPGGPPGAGTEEERPSRPHAARPRFSFTRPRRKAMPKAKVRKAFRRVSIAPLIEDAYSDIAWAAAGIPPLQRLLYAQAPIAGVVLDPVVKDTVADRIVQPMARNYERMKVGMALVGTPMALMAVLATAPEPVLMPMANADGTPMVNADGTPAMALVPGEPSVQHQSAMLTLRYGVRAMADLAGDSMTRVRERAVQNAERDDMVNDFIGFLLGVSVPEGAGETAAREARDAGLKLAGVAE